MIITRTPFRMSYVGGGTDIPTFYQQEAGAVVSTSIDKFMYVTVHEKFDSGVRVAYSQTEEVASADKVQHPLVRESLALMGISGGLEITSTADIPAKGTGLGSSSSYTVGLLSALAAHQGLYVSPSELARRACEIEIIRCGEPIGKQDQYAAAIGGLKLYEFMPDETVRVSPVQCSAGFKDRLDRSTMVFYTGKTRSASKILAEQTQNSRKSDKAGILRRMAQLAREFKLNIENEDFAALGEALIENWELKKQLASGINNPLIDEMYQAGINAGALGGKLLGAGAGGFMMFFAEEDRQPYISEALNSFRQLNFKIENTGSQVIYYA